MTEHYRLEELDRDTRDYLALARDQSGRGMPGVFVGQSDALPVVGIVVGFAVILATVLVTFPPIDPPMKEALLQTAGLMLGGWLVLAAFRVWAGGKTGRYAGHFVYADAENLYAASGSAVEVTDLSDLREAKAVQNFNESKYQNTEITLRVGPEKKTVRLQDEDGGRRLTLFLNTLVYVREGGEDGHEEGLRKLSPEAAGAVAKAAATTGQFPANWSRAEEGHAVRVPQPRRDGRASTGILGLLFIAVVGAGVFYGLLTVNYPFRDEAVFARIQALPANEQPPALRLYLLNDKFVAHRDDARRLLAGHYEATVAANVNGADADLKRGLAAVVLALKDKPTPALSLRAVEEGAPKGQEAGGATRHKAVGDRLADKWALAVGDELVAFAQLEDPDLPANVDLRWKFVANGDIAYTLTFRKSPDDEPAVSRSGTVDARADATKTAEALADTVLDMTVGKINKLRAVLPVQEDF